MFNDTDPKTNGEFTFFFLIKNYVNRIFDVGCSDQSIYIYFPTEVHYFDPIPFKIMNLRNFSTNNTLSFFNYFGLGKTESEMDYFPSYESLYNRTESCNEDDEVNKLKVFIRQGKNYMIENNIQNLDFLKIDTEGHELEVILGFEELIQHVNIIQFEYGGTYKDSKLKLIDLIDYLKKYGFEKFSYLSPNGPVIIQDFTDHYKYCNIVCFNKNFNSSFITFNSE